MFLDDIVASSRKLLEERRSRFPLESIRHLASLQPPPLDFAGALKGESVRLIAEVKRASPSKGVIRQDFDPVEIAKTYAEGGAAAISVLTEPVYFQGSLNYLRSIRKGLEDKPLPLLRKDFVLDPYQVYEARAYGADCLLLIVAILSGPMLAEMIAVSRGLGMSCLTEVHNERELESALRHEEIIGINNRDLKTFAVDLGVTERLRPRVPEGRTVVSESGIKGREEMERLRSAGVQAVLIGEALMTSPDIALKMKEFTS